MTRSTTLRDRRAIADASAGRRKALPPAATPAVVAAGVAARGVAPSRGGRIVAESEHCIDGIATARAEFVDILAGAIFALLLARRAPTAPEVQDAPAQFGDGAAQ